MTAALVRTLRVRRRPAGAIMLAVSAGLVAASVAWGAQSAHSRSAGRLLRLGPGAQMTVPGTKLHCAVSASGGPTTIICGVGSAQSPRPGSYSFAVADSALLVFKASQSSMPLQLKRETEPTGSGGTYPGPTTAGGVFRAPVGTVATVGGTHIFCAVERNQAKVYVTCGPADGSAQFFVKSYVGAVSEQDIFVIRKLDQKRTKTVFQHKQP
jgi:hypothetical protein